MTRAPLLGFLLATTLLQPISRAHSQRVWHEAEEIRGNASIVTDYENRVSAAAYVAGGQWYRLVRIPGGQAAAREHAWVRIRASTDATIAVLDEEDKPLAWRTVPGRPEWQWLDFGPLPPTAQRFDLMPSTRATVSVDVVVVTDEADPEDFELLPAALDPGLHSTVWPQEAYEDTLYIAQGTAQHFYIVPANHERTPRESWSLVLEVPKSFRILPFEDRERQGLFARYTPSEWQRSATVRDGEPYVRHRFTFGEPLPFRPLPTVKSVDCVLLFTKASAARLGTYEFYYHMDGEDEHTLRVELLPPLRGRQPQQTDICLFTWFAPNASHAERRALIDTWRKAGINFVQVSGLNDRSAKLGTQLHAAGMRVIGNLWWFWWDDAYLAEHPDHVALNADGDEARIEGRPVVCPSVLLAPGNEALSRLLTDRIARCIRGGLFDGMGWDNEGPSPLSACFCDRCLQSFRDRTGLADTEVSRSSVIEERREQWIGFACWQNAQLLARMRDATHDARPGARMFAYSGQPERATLERYRVDWTQCRSCVDGAVICFYSHSPTTLASFPRWVGRCREAVGEGDHPPLLWAGLSSGDLRSPSGSYMQHPGLLKLQILKAIALGMGGAYIWWWGPLDGRHYHAIADATRLISDHEEWFVAARATQPTALVPEDQPWSLVRWRCRDIEIAMLFSHSPTDEQRLTLAETGLAGDEGRGWLDAQTEEPIDPRAHLALPPLGVRMLYSRK